MQRRSSTTLSRATHAVALAAAAFCVGHSTAATEAAPGVDPTSVTLDPDPGECRTVKKVVSTPVVPPQPDIVFLADTTGSMGSALANVKANIGTIMSTILLAQPTAAFGAAQYKDVGDSIVYQLGQALTTNTANVTTAVNAWSAGGGGDDPAAQLNPLHHRRVDAAVGYRTGGTRIVVWFGDQPGHDPSLGNTLLSVKAELVAANIRVVAVSVGDDLLDSSGQATSLTGATAGVLLHSPSTDGLSAAILAGIQAIPTTVSPKAGDCSPFIH